MLSRSLASPTDGFPPSSNRTMPSSAKIFAASSRAGTLERNASSAIPRKKLSVGPSRSLSPRASRRHGPDPCVDRCQNQWRFAVEDNGIGIPEQHREQIFGLFKPLHAVNEYPGTGLGLAISQRIVQRAGGRIWVESEPEQGSTFFFTLPAAD